METVDTTETAEPVGAEGPPATARAGTPWWRILVLDAAVLVGLAGVAITQPMLDLFGRNPTFFVAGGYGRKQIVAFALVVAFVPALAAFVLTAIPGLADRRVGRVLHGVGVALFAGLFGLVVCRTLGIDGVAAAALVALVLAVTVAVAEWRVLMARQFLSYLAIGNVAFLVLFLLSSPTSELLAASASSVTPAGIVHPPTLRGPVVVVVLDEFPLTSLLRPDGTINDSRYPRFAELARETTWFRNAASESTTTFVSVPSILTGRAASEDDLPTYQDHPRNYFTLLGGRYPVSRFEAVTDLCPPSVCAQRPPGHSVRHALDDASFVYRHRVLPESLRANLAPIDHSWGNFGDDMASTEPTSTTTVPTLPDGSPDPMGKLKRMAVSNRGRAGQAAAMIHQTDLIGGGPSVNLIHVLLPHHPYELTPWGALDSDTWLPPQLPKPSGPGYRFISREFRAMQAMQVGGVDRLVGHLVDHLKQNGSWDRATVVILSDHGVDATPPGFTRKPARDNLDELFRIPLFIKAPGQTRGEVRDEPASTLDVLPSLADILDVDTDWHFDGHSLFDGSEAKARHRLTSDVEAGFAQAGRQGALFPRGEGWDDLAAVGEAEDLVGRKVAELPVGAPSPLSARFDRADLLANLDPAAGLVPYSLRGTLRGGRGTPPELVVALNGTVSGTIGGYRPVRGAMAFSGLMANYFVPGRNQVTAYEVERTGSRVVLHPVRTG
jgi:Sulfatase